MSWETMVRLENLFRKLFPSVTAFKNPNAHFTPQVLLTLLKNRGSEVVGVDLEELRGLTTAMAELRDKVNSAVLAPVSLEEGNAEKMAAHLHECSTRLDQLFMWGSEN